MAKVETMKLHHLPFSFYNKDKLLFHYSVVAFLTKRGFHNVGLFKRLCGCFTDREWGTLGAEILVQLSELKAIPTPAQLFDITGLPKEMFPLSKPFDSGVDISKIDSWENYIKIREYSNDNPAPLLLEVPLTIWHIVNKFHLKKQQVPVKNGNYC
jgi:hypothetical protein